jgi:hypothetical protein
MEGSGSGPMKVISWNLPGGKPREDLNQYSQCPGPRFEQSTSQIRTLPPPQPARYGNETSNSIDPGEFLASLGWLSGCGSSAPTTSLSVVGSLLAIHVSL